MLAKDSIFDPFQPCTTPLQKENVFNFKILNLALLNLQKENVFNFCFIQYGTESLAVLIFMK